MPLIEIDKVSKVFAVGSVQAIKDISFDIAEGEFVSLLGPSGCGKSTLLMMIAGLEKPSGGEIRFRGNAVTKAGRERYVVFQEPSLFPWRTVLRNVTIGLEGQMGRKADEVARQYIELVGLSGFENAHPQHLSGGMKQRTALARGLSMRSDVLLMDEPFSAIDAQTRDSRRRGRRSFLLRTASRRRFSSPNGSSCYRAGLPQSGIKWSFRKRAPANTNSAPARNSAR
jgi:NitT/TauT family transport system ATP-binding protein